MAMLAGSRNPELWSARGALNKLRRLIAESQANRAASAQARNTRGVERLERRRNTLQNAVKRLSDATTAEDHDALVQGILNYYRDQGELERKAGG